MSRRPVVLALLLLAASLGGLRLFAGNSAQGEVHLLPKGYAGDVFVVYHAPSREPAEYDDRGRRVYRVPPGGVVLTPLAPNDGVAAAQVEFFSVDDRGVRAAIPKAWSSDKPEERARQKRVFAGSVGQMELHDINCRIVLDSYYVGTLDDLNSKRGTFDIEQYFRRNPGQCPPLRK
jgi:hypothetical protein